jgi:lipopolysaccharide heptosyltransferase II
VPATSHQIKKILVVRTDRLGDVILTLPMLPALRACYPDAYIAMLLNRYTGQIVEGNPFVNELLWYDDGGELIPFQPMLRLIREKQFEAAFIVHPTLRLAVLMFLAGIPLRIGTGYRYYSILFNRKVFEHRKDAKRHELEYNLNLLKELDCSWGGEPEFAIGISPESEVVVERLLHSFNIETGSTIVITHPGTGGSAREWPPECFGKLAAQLSADKNTHIIVTGRKGEEAKAEQIVKATNGKAVSVVGMLNLKELTALIRVASLFVSNSTGPLHIAAALGTPVVAIYPQLTVMSAGRWGPYTEKKRVFVPDKPIDCKECSGLKDEYCACMGSIAVDEVYAAAHELLAEFHFRARGIMTHE